jgi:hypothetical protein
MTPLLAAGPALRLACPPPAVQSRTTLPSPGALDDPALSPPAPRSTLVARRRHPEPDHPSLPPEPPMTPLLAAGPALDLGCTPPAVQSPTTLPSPRSPR